jgi:3-dehydroquinate synthetase
MESISAGIAMAAAKLRKGAEISREAFSRLLGDTPDVDLLIRTGGEPAKSSWNGVSELHRVIDQHHLDRHSYVVAIGGGALLDQVGLAAATAHRGVLWAIKHGSLSSRRY